MSSKKLLYLIAILSLYFSNTSALSCDLTPRNTIYYANDLKELIKNGQKVSCIDATIIGDLNLTGLDLQIDDDSLRIVNSPISIIDSEIKGNIDFGNALFKKPLDFRGSTFSGQHLNFKISEFASDIDFSEAKFRCTADLSGARFDGRMSSLKTIWSEGTNFDKIICNGYALFRGSEFQRRFSLKGAQMMDHVDFEDCSFNGEAYFSNSVFEKKANFLAVRFADFIELKGARFNESAIFIRS